MDRREARRLGDAITNTAGYRVLRIATVPGQGVDWQIELQDRITHLRYTVKSPADWMTVSEQCRRARTKMARENRFPEQPGQPSSPDRPPPTEDTGMEQPMSVAAPQPPTPGVGAFNAKQWETITRSAIATAEQEVAKLRAERSGLDEQIREAERRVRARRQEIDAAVNEHLGVIKRLHRALDVVERPASDARRFGAKTGVTAPKWGPIAIEYAKAHGGEIPVLDLAKAHGVFPSRFLAPLERLVQQGVLEKDAKYRYRVVAA